MPSVQDVPAADATDVWNCHRLFCEILLPIASNSPWREYLAQRAETVQLLNGTHNATPMGSHVSMESVAELPINDFEAGIWQYMFHGQTEMLLEGFRNVLYAGNDLRHTQVFLSQYMMRDAIVEWQARRQLATQASRLIGPQSAFKTCSIVTAADLIKDPSDGGRIGNPKSVPAFLTLLSMHDRLQEMVIQRRKGLEAAAAAAAPEEKKEIDDPVQRVLVGLHEIDIKEEEEEPQKGDNDKAIGKMITALRATRRLQCADVVNLLEPAEIVSYIVAIYTVIDFGMNLAVPMLYKGIQDDNKDKLELKKNMFALYESELRIYQQVNLLMRCTEQMFQTFLPLYYPFDPVEPTVPWGLLMRIYGSVHFDTPPERLETSEKEADVGWQQLLFLRQRIKEAATAASEATMRVTGLWHAEKQALEK